MRFQKNRWSGAVVPGSGWAYQAKHPAELPQAGSALAPSGGQGEMQGQPHGAARLHVGEQSWQGELVFFGFFSPFFLSGK